MSYKKWYIVEGNIGSGKSTLLIHLNNLNNVEIIPEPVDVWTNIKDDNNKNLLEHFYEDMDRYSYMFQAMVFKTRLESIDTPQKEKLRFSERSIWTDRHVFGKMCIQNKKMNSIETECYNYWFNWLENKFRPKPDCIIYIRCSPEKCLERIKQRGRSEESSVSLEYLQKLHNYHEDWLNNWKQTDVFVIDNEKDNDWSNILQKINNNLTNEYVYSYYS